MTGPALDFIERPSPNHDERRGKPIDMLLLHYTGMQSGAEALERLRDPEAAVSAHYLVEEDGRVFRLVAEERRAWHAGKSYWAGEKDINARSIGIEIVNPGHEFGYRDFPESQMRNVIALCRDILTRHDIPPERVLGHSDVAPDRKSDPGERFDWQRLARDGIGLWPERRPASIDETLFFKGLAAFGYGPANLDPKELIVAFQRHFRPSSVDGRLDRETMERLAGLKDLLGLPLDH